MDLQYDLGYVLGLSLSIRSVGMVIPAYPTDVSMFHGY